MKFRARNLYYLRVSENTVLPVYLYLDEKHIEWMSERVLQFIIADLQPLIIPKLIAEENAHLGPGGPSNAKKGTVEVHRGDTYQFGYFLRNTQPHSVLIKNRTFVAAPKGAQSNVLPPPPPEPSTRSGVERRKSKRARPSKKASSKGKGKARAATIDLEDDITEILDDDDVPEVVQAGPRRSKRQKKTGPVLYAELEDNEAEMVREANDESDEDMYMEPPGQTGDTMDDPVKVEDDEPTLEDRNSETNMPPPASPAMPPVEDTEEEFKKPVMQLKYQGFSINGRCLCLIVEPYPPIRQHREMSLRPMGLQAPRAPSMAPPSTVPRNTSVARAQTPLFLPDLDDSMNNDPADLATQPPTAPYTIDSNQDDKDDGGMMVFSQILQSVGEYNTGTVEDDDEMEGLVLLGDADEARNM